MDSFSSLMSVMNNAVLLVALGVIYDAVGIRHAEQSRRKSIISGILVGIIGIAVMIYPWELSPGVQFDTRWILLSLSGLFFGVITTLIAGVMTIIFRLYQGGAGMYVGILVIVFSAVTGMAFRKWLTRNQREVTWKSLYFMGILVEVEVVLIMLLLPNVDKYDIILTIIPTLFIIYPIGTVLLGLLLKRQRDKKQLEHALQEKQIQLDAEKNLLKSIIDGIPDLIFFKSKDGTYLGCNKAFCEFIGLDDEAVKGKNDYDLFEHTRADGFRKKDKEVLQTGLHDASEYWETYPDGSSARLYTLKTPFYDQLGQPCGVVCISRDVTDKKLIEQALQKSEMTYRAVLSTAIDGFFIVSMEGRITRPNQSYINMSGYSEAELKRMPVNNLEASGNPEHLFNPESVKRVIQEKYLKFTSMHRHKQGHLFHVETSICYWPEDGGQFFVFIKDISERIEAENKLILSESKFKQIFEKTANIAVQGYDRNRRVIYWNRASESLYGYTQGHALGQTLENLIIPEPARQKVAEQAERWVTGGEPPHPAEIDRLTANGSLVSVYSSHVLIENANNETEMYCIDIDLTAQKKAEEQAYTLSQAIDQSPITMVLTDTMGNIEYVNSTFETVTGYLASEVIGQPSSMLKSGRTSKSKYQQLWGSIIAGKAWQGELQNKKKNGDIFWEHAHIAPVLDSFGIAKHYLAVKQDITQYKLQEEKILHQAHYDSLTKLPNRLLSLDRLSQMLKDATRSKSKVAVFFLDLDDFKKVNDTLGHQVGDELLVQAATRLTKCIRNNDVVGRLGGDEFIIILNNIAEQSAIATVAEKLLEQFSAPFHLQNRELVSTLSIGISLFPDDSRKPAELLRQADSAMYHSKEMGRNMFNFFTKKMNEDIHRRLRIEEQLRGALQHQELEVYFQPLVDIGDRKIIGAEALLRWKNSELGQVTPDEFIPIAEQTGLIVPIGRYVLETAIRAAAQWQNAYHQQFRIAINVSPKQFRDTSFIDMLQALLLRYQVAASSVELEITEGVLLSGDRMIAKTLKTINDLGISISMDDFGTGYSSLSYLRSYPFDTLKVDKSFINDITLDPSNLELVGAAIAMGHGLNLNVIAEGVETEEQYQLLNALKCNYGQGYLFSKPLPQKEFERLLYQDTNPVSDNFEI